MDRLFKLQMACTKLAEGNNLGKTQNPFEEQRRPFSSARGLFHCLRLTDCHKEVESSSVAFFHPRQSSPLLSMLYSTSNVGFSSRSLQLNINSELPVALKLFVQSRPEERRRQRLSSFPHQSNLSGASCLGGK